MRQGVRPVCVGLLVGVAAALAAGQWIRSFLFGTEAHDPVAISAVVLCVPDRSDDCPAQRVNKEFVGQPILAAAGFQPRVSG